MTPHNEASKEDIAKLVIMPGDPKRAEYIAKNYLEDYRLVNTVRGMNSYTGKYKDKKVTIMPSGMGMPSMGIYATELFKEYDVEKIIRVGTCGALQKEYSLNDVLLAKESFTTSNYVHSLTGTSKNIETASFELNETIKNNATKLDIPLKEVTINTSDIFYREFIDETIDNNNCAAVEMETFVLLYLAKHFSKEASAILTVSDSLITGENLTPEERETSLDKAIIIALESL